MLLTKEKLSDSLGPAFGGAAFGFGVERIIEGFSLPLSEGGVAGRGVIESMAQTGIQVINHLSQSPIIVVLIVFPTHLMAVQENTRTWSSEKLVDLTADVTKVNVGSHHIRHVDGCSAALIDENIGPTGVMARQQSAMSFGAFEQDHMRCENKIVIAIFDKEIQDFEA